MSTTNTDEVNFFDDYKASSGEEAKIQYMSFNDFNYKTSRVNSLGYSNSGTFWGKNR